jgi:DNA ligase (NAD+)
LPSSAIIINGPASSDSASTVRFLLALISSGKTTNSVSKKTDYLINNDSLSTSSKNKKAKELGVSIITEEEFMTLAGVER